MEYGERFDREYDVVKHSVIDFLYKELKLRGYTPTRRPQRPRA